ncbi:unnamed protein product [Cylindrotheca closterium]|uniref:Uncharacterized protein n=1 Tax=Cylindrotheca closterium TaxID=2856 RepID=A0AAD2FGE3_9STRA|nr:unnamed protein product [Cylindrotheca closterium]
MGNFMSLATGFFWGSAITGAASFLYFNGQRRPQIDEFSLALEERQKSIRRDVESVNFLSDLVKRLWVHLSPAIGDTIVAAVEPMFKDMLPGPLSSLKFTKCDLGKVPLTLDNIVVHPLKNGKIQCDVDMIWDGACDINLAAGKLKLGAQNVKLMGRLQLIFKPLSDVLPCIGAIQYGFINKPALVIDFTGLGNVADLGGIDAMIRGIIKGAISGVMVLPARLCYKMDVNCDYRDAFVAPEGIARLTAVRGRGFVIEKKTIGKDDIPDCYLKISLGDRTWTTSVIKDDLSPKWLETGDFLLSDYDQHVRVEAWDEDSGTMDSDDFLGQVEFTVAELMLSGRTKEFELLDDNNSPVGAFVTMHCEVANLVSNPTSFSMPPPANHLGGLFTVMVTKAFNLPLKKEDCESFVRIKYGKQEPLLTGIVTHLPDYPYIDALNPVYDVSYVIPITPEMIEGGLPDVTFELTNTWAKQTVLGSLTIPHQEMLEAKDNTIKDTRTIGSAQLEFQVSIQGFDEHSKFDATKVVRKSIPKISATGTTEEADVQQVKVTILGGQGFKIKKKKLRKNDIPDVYCNVKFASSPNVWRTATIKDSVNPIWNESKIYNLANERAIINIQAMDANKRGDDTELGGFRVQVSKILLNGGKMDLELEQGGKGQEAYITVQCELVSGGDKKDQ